MPRKTICIGIVAFNGLEDQVLEDYLRLIFHLGRRQPEWEFQLAIKTKSEQFRARNAIVRQALQFGAEYIWMLDDDHIIDIGKHRGPSDSYDLPVKLVKHLEDNPKIGVVGALYFQRGGDYYPVIMQEREGSEAPFFLHHCEIAGGMQRVDVTGGGCMMIRSSVFDNIEDPWFAPEHEFGTDIQLCKQVRKAGYEVWCDTSLEIGHLRKEREIISSRSFGGKWGKDELSDLLLSYRKDAEAYLGKNFEQIGDLASEYKTDLGRYPTLQEYYASKGPEQLARQVAFHHHKNSLEQAKAVFSMVDTSIPARGVDVGCGSAPIGFELALRGHEIDFIDLDGAGAYEFVKWRAKRHPVRCGFDWSGEYDYALFLDSIEHVPDWRGLIDKAISYLKTSGVIVTNYFLNRDFDNPEHVSMDHAAVREYLQEKGFTQKDSLLWARDA